MTRDGAGDRNGSPFTAVSIALHHARSCQGSRQGPVPPYFHLVRGKYISHKSSFLGLVDFLPSIVSQVMSQAVLAKQEPTLSSYEDTMNQSSPLEPFHVETPVSSDFNVLKSTTIWGFSLLLIILIVRLFGRQQKLPAGAKQLPRLPGEWQEWTASVNAR